jgi:hypothetical protein
MSLHSAVTAYLELLDRGDYSYRELDAARETMAAEAAADAGVDRTKAAPKKSAAKKTKAAV